MVHFHTLPVHTGWTANGEQRYFDWNEYFPIIIALLIYCGECENEQQFSYNYVPFLSQLQEL